MKHLTISVLLLFAAIAAVFSAAAPERIDNSELVIYTYDSFVAEWGPGPIVIPAFEREHQVDIRLVSAGDAGQVLARLLIEKESPVADVVIGLDNNLLARAREEGVLEPYEPEGAGMVASALVLDPDFLLTPYDYGFFAFVWDSEALEQPPGSLEDLTDPRYREKIILQDPRTSSPGLGFLLWTVAVYGENYLDYWERLLPNVLAITDGWDSAYGMFTAGEAPLVLSYTTSPAYHAEYEGTDRYRALIFPEGHYIQLEGLGVVTGTEKRDLARRFVDFALSRTFQEALPLTNWMYPVRPDLELPDSFDLAPVPEVTLRLDEREIAANYRRWVDDWVRVVIQ